MVCNILHNILWCYAKFILKHTKCEILLIFLVKSVMIINMKINVVREKRRTISLKVLDSGNAVLKVPQSISEKKVKEFVNSKQGWLEKTSARMKDAEDFSKSFDFKKYIYLNGKQAGKVDDVVIGFDKLTPKAKRLAVKRYYLSMFSNLEDLAEELSAKTGLKYNDIKPTGSVRVWGSYNSKGLMKLNYKLLILPEELAVYVVCHELCHSLHMNHKPQFWKHLSTICPNYKMLKKEMSRYSFVLKTDF